MKKQLLLLSFIVWQGIFAQQAPAESGGGIPVTNLHPITRQNTSISAKNTSAKVEPEDLPNPDPIPTGASTEAGITAGQLSVSPSGGATYQLPITLPPGIRGVAPSVSLAYNSQSGNGLAGYGWSVAGLSTITRIPATLFHDGVLDPVDFDALDRFALDGQRLILKSGSYGGDGAVYETETYSLLKVSSHGVSPYGASYGPAYFLVAYPDGAIAYYGYTSNARSRTDYALSYWQNAQGLRISYRYNTNGGVLSIDRIQYGSLGDAPPINEIQFIYKPSMRPENAFIGGYSFTRSILLSDIQVTSGGAGFRTYRLTHASTSVSYQRLVSVQESDGEDNSHYNPTVFRYDDTSQALLYNPVQTSLSLQNIEQRNAEAVTGDFDGDGAMDFIVHPRESNPGHLKDKYWLFTDIDNQGGTNFGWEHEVGLFASIFPVSWLSHTDKLMPMQGWAVLKTNPGSLDLTVYSAGTASPIYQQYERTFTWPAADANLPVGEELEHVEGKTLSGDFNGDGLTDLLALRTADGFKVCRKYGCVEYSIQERPNKKVYFVNLDRRLTTNFASLAGELETYIDADTKLYAADVTGDGKTDLLVFDENVVRVYGLDEANQLSLLWTLHDPHISVSATRPVWLGDYNGDGKTDFIIPKDYGNDYARYTATGTGFSKTHQNYSILHQESIDIPPSLFQHTDYFVQNTVPVDINKDGKTDLVQLESRRYGGEPVRYTVTVYENKNAGFVESATQTVNPAGGKYPLPVFLTADKPNHQLEVALMSDNEIFHFRYQKDVQREGLLRQITYGDGLTEAIVYEPLRVTDEAPDGLPLYEPALYTETYPYSDIGSAPSLWVVAERQKGGVRQRYGYYGAVTHLQGLGFMGFRATAQTSWYNPELPVHTQVTRYQPALRGAPVQQYTMLNLPASLQPNPYSYIQKTDYTYQSSLSAGGVFQLRNILTQTHNALEDVTTSLWNDSNEYGQVTTATATVAQGAQLQRTGVTQYVYDNQPEAAVYVMGRLLNRSETVTAYGDVFSSEESYQYDGSGNLAERQKRGHQTEPVTETYTYDPYGNPLSQTLGAPGETPRTIQYQYDPTGRFVTTTTQPNGLATQATHHPLYGLPLTVTDPFGLTTGYKYDSWGKKTQQTDYLGNTVQWNYTQAEGHYTVQETRPDGGASQTISDALGRVVRSGATNRQGQWVYTETRYDAAGRKTHESEPFTDSPSQWSTISYDLYSRPVQTVAPTGRTTTMSYNGLTTTVNDGVQTNVTVKDALGNVQSHSDPGGTIAYTYFANGNLKTADYQGVVISIEQDGWGRKIRLDDPSAGVYTYAYNGFGELVQETTPNGTTSYSLDETGRLLQKTLTGEHTDQLVDYGYDPVTRQLTEVNGTSQGESYTYTYTYDGYQRLTETLERTPWAQFSKTLSYDNLGRLAAEGLAATHAASSKSAAVTLGYVYENGFLQTLRDTTTGAALWEAKGDNVRGQLTQGTYGNGITVTNSYDQYGYPVQAQHQTQSGENRLTLDYSFEPQRGLLQSRSSSLFSTQESFQYDELDRLTQAGGQVQAYDARGRITQNPGVGAYAYAGAQPYQATQLTLTPQAHTYYQQRGTQTVTYNAFKSPVTLHQKGAERMDFSYNLFQSRSARFYGSGDEDKWARPLRKFYAADGSTEISLPEPLPGGGESVGFVFYIGGDAYSAPAVLKSDGTTSEFLYLHRDYLGSILAISNQDAELVEKRHFDAWGNVVYAVDGNDNPIPLGGVGGGFDRGYTGHEHLQSVGLIHMNGRLYDPLLHRFLAPDNYVQDPYNTQNFNRYGYVLNNPLLYTDESGEFAFLAVVAVAAAVFGVGNTVAHAIRGDIHNMGDAFKYFAQGAVTGAAIASLAYVPILGAAIQIGGVVQGGMAALSAASGIARGIGTGDWSTLGNAGKLLLGNFYLDENRSFFAGAWQGISRFTWEAPQTALGSSLAHLKNSIGKVDRVDYFGGATFATNENANSREGISLGNFINIDIPNEIIGSFDARVIDDPLYMHEYGHTFDSQIFGLTYLFSIGAPSLISASNSRTISGTLSTHDIYWTERWANRHAARYFGKHFGVDWTQFEPPFLDYPR